MVLSISAVYFLGTGEWVMLFYTQYKKVAPFKHRVAKTLKSRKLRIPAILGKPPLSRLWTRKEAKDEFLFTTLKVNLTEEDRK